MTVKNRVVTLLLILNLCFIWLHSLVPAAASSAESGTVLQLVEPLLAVFLGEGNVTEFIVRKLAHFSEFALLGGLSVCKGLAMGKRLGIRLWRGCALFCWLAAFTDESLQLFSHRGSRIEDVWLDLCGALFGIALLSAAEYLIRRLSRRKRRKDCA